MWLFLTAPWVCLQFVIVSGCFICSFLCWRNLTQNSSISIFANVSYSVTCSRATKALLRFVNRITFTWCYLPVRSITWTGENKNDVCFTFAESVGKCFHCIFEMNCIRFNLAHCICSYKQVLSSSWYVNAISTPDFQTIEIGWKLMWILTSWLHRLMSSYMLYKEMKSNGHSALFRLNTVLPKPGLLSLVLLKRQTWIW